MTAAVEASGLGKRYGNKWALTDCSLAIPAGKVVGLVGPNGAGKSTLLQLAVGLVRPDAGSIALFGEQPGSSPEQLARVGFVGQDTPTYGGWSIRDHLWFGAQMNPGWDEALAAGRIAELGLDPRQKARQLSGGQRAQLALTLAVAKRPDLLLLDEPVAALDPLARREFLQGVMEVVADQQASVVLSSHLVSDLERVCDYLVILVDSRVRLAGEIDELVAAHYRLVGPRRERGSLPGDLEVLGAHHTDKQSTLLVRAGGPILDPSWTVQQLDLEDLVLAYMTRAVSEERRPQLELRS